MSAEFTGSWVRRNGIMVPVPPPPVKRVGRKPRKVLFDWDDEQLKAAHAGYFRGDRDLWTREGERLYNSRRRRVQQQRLSAEDRQWCEKQAVRFSWIVDTQTNRRASVANTQ